MAHISRPVVVKKPLEAMAFLPNVIGEAEAVTDCVAKQSRYDSLILGDGPTGIYSMDPQVTPVNNNVLVIAGTGGGKTKSVVEANLLHAENQSMAVLLTKRRLLDQYRGTLKKRGYRIRVLNLVNPDESGLGFDPMLHIKDDSDLALLAKSLMECTGDTSERDRYWQNSAASLFCAFAKLAIHKYGKGARMKHVLYLLRQILGGAPLAEVAAAKITLFEETEIMATFETDRQKGIGAILQTIRRFAAEHVASI